MVETQKLYRETDGYFDARDTFALVRLIYLYLLTDILKCIAFEKNESVVNSNPDSSVNYVELYNQLKSDDVEVQIVGVMTFRELHKDFLSNSSFNIYGSGGGDSGDIDNALIHVPNGQHYISRLYNHDIANLVSNMVKFDYYNNDGGSFLFYIDDLYHCELNVETSEHYTTTTEHEFTIPFENIIELTKLKQSS